MSSTSTALIIRPADAPDIHVLECDGPHGFVHVNRYPGVFSNTAPMPFEEYKALPDHLKFPRDPATWEIEHNTARRIYRLMEYAARADGYLSPNQIREIRGRLRILSSHCDVDF